MDDCYRFSLHVPRTGSAANLVDVGGKESRKMVALSTALNIWPTKPLARWSHKNTLKSSYTCKMYNESQFYNLLDSIQNSVEINMINYSKFVDVFVTKSNKTNQKDLILVDSD